LDLGSGFGYSALWHGSAAPENSEITGIVLFPKLDVTWTVTPPLAIAVKR
jgi:hypothetical protein